MLYDTDVLIWALRGSRKAAREIDNDSERYISAINYMELLQGARDKREQNLIKDFLVAADFQILPITEAISHHAMIFIEEYSLKFGISLADALVFATACECSLCLCSANQKHYHCIIGLNAKQFKPDNFK